MSKPACWFGSFASLSEYIEQCLKNKTPMIATVVSLRYVKRPATSAKAAEAVL